MKLIITISVLGAFIWLSDYSLDYAEGNTDWLSRLHVAYVNGGLS